MVCMVPTGLPLKPAIEAMLMMRPYWRGIIERLPTACDTRKMLRIFRFITLSHASTGWSSAGAPQLAPALLTRMSMWPSRASAASTSAVTCSSRDRSAATAWAVTPCSARKPRASSRSACLREEITTWAPCSPSARAICKPRPREPPVTSAVLPASENNSWVVRMSRPYYYVAWLNFVVHALPLGPHGADEGLDGDVLGMLLIRVQRRLVGELGIQDDVVGRFQSRLGQHGLELEDAGHDIGAAVEQGLHLDGIGGPVGALGMFLQLP